MPSSSFVENRWKEFPPEISVHGPMRIEIDSYSSSFPKIKVKK